MRLVVGLYHFVVGVEAILHESKSDVGNRIESEPSNGLTVESRVWVRFRWLGTGLRSPFEYNRRVTRVGGDDMLVSSEPVLRVNDRGLLTFTLDLLLASCTTAVTMPP